MPLKGEEGSDSENKEVQGSNAGCDRVAVRVPSFWTNNAKLFFIQLQASFRLAGVTVEQTKFDYLVAALDPETLSHATDIVCEPPPHPYTALKSRLLTQFEVSQHKKLKTLIEYLELGDRSPSVLLKQMRDLSESHVDEAFLKNIWMRRLPSHVQVVLAVISESLSKLVEMADKIIEFSPGAVNSVSDSAFASCHVSQRDEQLLKIQKQIDEISRLVRSGSRHASPRPHRNRSPSKTGAQKREDWQCWYHFRIATFGTKLLSLDLGLRRTLQWPFIVADVTKLIIGADFLQHFGLLINLKKRCLIDPLTNFTAEGKSTVSDIPVVKTIVGNSEYSELLRKFNEITQLNSFPKDAIKHDTVHYIPTVGPPVSARARRLNPAQLKIAKQEFEYLLEKGICRPSKSNWASPLHMVAKGTSDCRSTGDYRALNRITIPDKYPIPHIQDCMYLLNGKKVFSKADLVRAYHQIPVHPPDIPKTAVITPFGLFEFPFLNFGLCSAAQTFQGSLMKFYEDSIIVSLI
ncbi:Transposon Ty3-G Gag-Pol polyprotein [Araneus ventricosus]|uniref:Transposon Ty3-G Gag-Pol polyprotein n=1 Tax=Araneus ventricosus TaxID=182803 RepID=A0A4Y2CLU7_ARAVE|nr:Transposon Ty3-G Gag-Pol polyprotein [Araneus ventricosus]